MQLVGNVTVSPTAGDALPKLIHHAHRRLKLINAAWDLIAADGIYDATVRHVAERAQVAPGSVRYIFRSQDELLMAVVAELVERVRSDVAKRASGYSRPEQAAARLSVAVPRSDEQELLWQVERALGSAPPSSPLIRRRAGRRGPKNAARS